MVDFKNGCCGSSAKADSRAVTFCLVLVALGLMVWVVCLLPAAIDQQFDCVRVEARLIQGLPAGQVAHQGGTK